MNEQYDVNSEREPETALDKVLRAELRWEAPSHVTNNLLALVALASSESGLAFNQSPAFEPPERPKRWYVILVSVLTTAAIVVSLMVAWQFSTHMGLPAMWQSISETIGSGIDQINTSLPQLSTIVSLISGVRNYLYWLLLVAVLWAVFDGWSPNNMSSQRQQVS
jgi:CDP-diglyceride synthetase